MEQKKILWIVITVGIFILVIFGTALVLYSPSRSTGQTIQESSPLTPGQNGDSSNTSTDKNAQNDPGKGSADIDQQLGLGTEIMPAPGSINLTIVNGENATANYGVVDVNGLTKKNPLNPQEGGLPPENIPGQDTPKTADQTMSTKVEDKASAAVAVAEPEKPVKTVKKAVAKPTPAPAKKAVTEYWIQAGSFTGKINAEQARKVLASRYMNAEIFTKASGASTVYRVRIGPYKTKPEAEYWLGTVKEIRGFTTSYVSEVKTKK